MKYTRPPGAGTADFGAAREYELKVGQLLGPYRIDNLDSPDRMDFWVPAVFLDVKERRQPIGARWPIPESWAREDTFIIDELSLRRAMLHAPSAYFWLHTCDDDRVHLARVDEILCAERVRVDRETSPGRSKGKWLVSLSDFRDITAEVDNVLQIILQDQIEMKWKQSPLLKAGL